MRGQAGVLKQQGDVSAAEKLLAAVVQSQKQFEEVQHLTHADYGSVLHHLGRLPVSVDCLLQHTFPVWS